MKLIIVALALVAAVAALPAQSPTKDAEVEILKQENESQPDGSYKTGFELTDGTHRQEQGTLNEAEGEDGKLHTVLTVRGSFGYVNTNGEPEEITYYADQTGFHAEGKSIPKAE